MITNLTGRSVSILTIRDGVNHRVAYCNDTIGRKALAAEQDENTVHQIMEVWGDRPALPDEIFQPEIPQPPSMEERLAALEAVQLDMILGGGE